MRFSVPLSFAEVMEALGPVLLSTPDPGPGISARLPDLESVAAPNRAARGSLVFLAPGLPLAVLENLPARAAVVEKGFRPALPLGILQVTVASMYRALHLFLLAFADRLLPDLPSPADAPARDPVEEPAPGPARDPAAFSGAAFIHPRAVVEGEVGAGCDIGPGAYVARGAVLGRGVKVGPQAVLHAGVRVGDACHIQAGAVLGSEGFGFYAFEGHTHAMPHFAGVTLGERVVIGPNSVVAAGVLHATEIGADSKLDSQVQVAHNVRIGRNAFLASKAGIAGSTWAGDFLRMGGASSVDGHLVLGDRVSIAACSGVTKNLPDGAVVAGFPAQPIALWRQREAWLRRQARGEG